MKTIKIITILALTVFASSTAYSQQSENMETNEKSLKTYVIERDIPGAGNLTGEELVGISQKSCTVIDKMGPSIEWLHSYVTDDKVYCVYRAENKEMILEHAEKGGFPANSIKELMTKISPATASNPNN